MGEEHSVEVMYCDEKGYIVRCTCCQQIQIVYGNIAIDQTAQDFRYLSQLIDRYRLSHRDSEAETCRNIFIKTPFKNLRILFSYKELLEFHEMLQKVLLMLEAEQLLEEL
ncbi:MAG: DUF6686 family protein [Bacteroidota bacterium]